MKSLVLTAAAFLSAAACADLEPVRTYYPVSADFPVKITGGAGELVILAPDNTEVMRADVPAGFEGEAKLDEVFAGIWELTTVHYLQHVIDGEPQGSALVLDPMVETKKPVVRQSPRGPQLERWLDVPKAQQAMAGFRVYTEQYPVLHTTEGDIKLALRPDEAPNTCWNFRQLVKGGFYTNIPFHRIIGPTRTPHGKGFMIQVGDPTGTGMGGPGYSVDLEASTIPHDLGVISMAREGSDLDTAGSQIFICLSRQGTSFLDRQYTSFGHTIEGVETVLDLGDVETDQSDRPYDMPYIETADLVNAAPRKPGEPPAWIAKTDEETGTRKEEDEPVDR